MATSIRQATVTELGIPEMLTNLVHTILEGLPDDKSQEWRERFLSAIKPDADLSRVGWNFLHWLLTNMAIRAYNHEKNTVSQCADVLIPLTVGRQIDQSAAETAESAAGSAALAAEAAESAMLAAMAESKGLAESVELAALSMDLATKSVTLATELTESAVYEQMADKLIQLIQKSVK